MNTKNVLRAGVAAALLGLTVPLSTNVMATPQAGAGQQVEGVPFLGVNIVGVPPALAAQLPAVVANGQGVVVQQVEPGSPADKAGITPFDILLSYEDQRLYSPEQLIKLVRADKPGHEITLKLLRRGQEREARLVLAGRAPNRAQSIPMPHRPFNQQVLPQRPAPGHADEGMWQSFDSLNLTSLGDGRYRAVVDYLNTKGEKQHLEFEGTREEIRTDIQERDDLPVGERQQLLRALNLDTNPWTLFPTMPRFEFPRMMPWSNDGSLF